MKQGDAIANIMIHVTACLLHQARTGALCSKRTSDLLLCRSTVTQGMLTTDAHNMGTAALARESSKVNVTITKVVPFLNFG